MHTINLVSGGLDSFLCWSLFAPHASNVYVRIGHRYQDRELTALRGLTESDPRFSFTILDGPAIGSLEQEGSGIIPCRNALLVLTVAAFAVGSAEEVRILIGALAGELNTDKSEEFCGAVTAVANISCAPQYWTRGTRFEVMSILRPWTKSALLRRFIERGGDARTLAPSVSCYAGTVDHCGACPSCVKRWIAFRAASIKDPTVYHANPRTWAGVPEILRKARDGTYDVHRARETLIAFGEKL